MEHLYFDHNATTPLDPRVAEAMAECDRAGYANPASQHAAGRRARRVLEAAREQVARLLGAQCDEFAADRLIFTSGATEANNLAMFGLAGRAPAHVLVSPLEHPSVSGPADELERRGWQVERLPVDAHGVVDPEGVRKRLRPDTRLVSVMLGNNDTGVLQPVAELGAVCREAGVLLHTDAVQAVGKIEVAFRGLGVDALSFSGHKFHGPRGIGGLLVRHGVTLEPVLFGGFQQGGLRPGTESVSLAVGLQCALERWSELRDERRRTMTRLRERFEQGLRSGWSDLVVHGVGAQRLPHTSCVSFRGLDRQALAMALDLAGVACSTGSACASGSTEPSPALVAMGCDEADWSSAIRFSLGATTEAGEVDQAVERILKTCHDLQSAMRGKKRRAAARGNSPDSL